MNKPLSTNISFEQTKEGKGGKGGKHEVSNAEFVAAVFNEVPEGAFVAICSKDSDPSVGGWMAQRADRTVLDLPATNNNYVGCSSFFPGDDGSFKARKAQFAAYHFLMLDDLGTKVSLEQLAFLSCHG